MKTTTAGITLVKKYISKVRLKVVNILCVIDSLGSGGAQRQLTTLASGLAANGHSVTVFTYHPQLDFFRNDLVESRVRVIDGNMSRTGTLGVLRDLRTLIKENSYDVAVSFLASPSLLLEIAKVTTDRKLPLVVSERNSVAADGGWISAFLLRLFHNCADVVTTNSLSHGAWLKSKKWLKTPVSVIYNGYDLEKFSAPRVPLAKETGFDYLVISRVAEQKNPVNLMKGIVKYFEVSGRHPRIWWVGKQVDTNKSRNLHLQIDEMFSSYPQLGKNFTFVGERGDIDWLLSRAKALLHVSLYEGLPNVVCEAFAAGCPVVASAIGDHRFLVAPPSRGFLCDPKSPDSICEALAQMEALSDDELAFIGKNCRRFAKEHLSADTMVKRYASIFANLARE